MNVSEWDLIPEKKIMEKYWIIQKLHNYRARTKNITIFRAILTILALTLDPTTTCTCMRAGVEGGLAPT